MPHYFIADNSLKSDIKKFTHYFGGEKFTFKSDSGVFSHGHVDPASDLLIKTLPKLSGSLLDLGCGYGPIGVMLGKVYGLTVTMADVNSRALSLARENCDANGVTAELVLSDSFESISGCFDTITLNPPIHAGKDIMFAMYEGAKEHLTPGGTFYIVIQEKHGAKSSIKKLTELFGECKVLYKKKGVYVVGCGSE